MAGMAARARRYGADIVVFPELAICGYPPEDLLLKPQFIETNLEYLRRLVKTSEGITIVAGFVDAEQKKLFNAATIISDGKLVGSYQKIFLPNYGVFDEKRYFSEGDRCPVFSLGPFGFGVTICEDIWYDRGPAAAEALAGAGLLINISASPYHYRKAGEREEMLVDRAREYQAYVAYCNLVGGQDELVFDGSSLMVGPDGKVAARGRPFEEDLVIADLGLGDIEAARREGWEKNFTCAPGGGWASPRLTAPSITHEAGKPEISPRSVPELSLEAEIYTALVLGTRDYFSKNGFKKAAIGLSGGLDSSLVATVAVDALGEGNVVGVSMPSRFSSTGSIADAEQLCRNLGIRLINMPIEKVFEAYLDTMADAFRGQPWDTTEENIQARIRGNFLMALSNKFGWLVLPTGNKSEMAAGYATLYGDMAGGFAILKDVPKTLAYRLADYRNTAAGYDIIPQTVIEKPPSAELRPGQKDTDSLPPYDVLDPVIKAYVEDDWSVEQMVAAGMDERAVRLAVRLIDASEYKRRQAPPGIKITARAFGKDRRLPITNKFKGNSNDEKY
jgi:NAD+ synthase (glutamine-hydrolysing)